MAIELNRLKLVFSLEFTINSCPKFCSYEFSNPITISGRSKKDLSIASGLEALKSKPAKPKSTIIIGTPTAFAVSKSVEVSPTINDCSTRPPEPVTAAMKGAGSGFLDERVSDPINSWNKCLAPNRTINSSAKADGLFVQIAEFTPKQL